MSWPVHRGGRVDPKHLLFAVIAGNTPLGSGPQLGRAVLLMGGWWELARAWLYLQFKRSYSIGAKDEAAATLSVFLSPMAEGL